VERAVLALLAIVSFIVLIGIAGRGFDAACAEAAKRLPMELRDSLAIRFAVDPFIWSPGTDRALRRDYVVSQASGVAAILCLAGFVSQYELYPALAFMVIAVLVATLLAWKCLRYGR
jgi:hypothetical protein